METNAWEFIISNDARIRSIINCACHNYDMREDVWSEVVLERTASILERFDPARAEGASVWTFYVNNLRWYIFKWLQAAETRSIRNVHVSDYVRDAELSAEAFAALAQCTDSGRISALEAKDIVHILQGQLDESEYQLLACRFILDYSFRDLAATFDMPESSIRAEFNRVLAKCRRVLASMDIS